MVPGTAMAAPTTIMRNTSEPEVVENGADDDADSNRQRRQSPDCVNPVSHYSHLLSRYAQSKGRLFALLLNFERKVNIYISVLGQKVKFSVKLHHVL